VLAGSALWRAGRSDLRPGEKVTVGLPASDVILARERPEALSARNVLRGEVGRVTGSSEVVIATVDIGASSAVELTPAATAELDITAGSGHDRQGDEPSRRRDRRKKGGRRT
jgi:ABC-type molybdate transport system ATPase subunit